MDEYASKITGLKLYDELRASAGRDGLARAEVDLLSGLIARAAEDVGPALEQIQQIFPLYTLHNLQHSYNLVRLMGEFIPAATRYRLNALELSLLILAALFHDMGMIVSHEEKATIAYDVNFLRFRNARSDSVKKIEEARRSGREQSAGAVEDALLAQYLRRMHPERARFWIHRFLKDNFRLRSVDLAGDLGDLCESHAWSFEASVDSRGQTRSVAALPDDRRIGNVPLNLRYLSCCLRLADALDFDRSRTPLTVMELVDFSEPNSWQGWSEHLSIDGWSITETEVRLEARCDHPAYYVAVHQLVDAIDRELTQSRYLIDQERASIGDRYRLSLPRIVDRRGIRMRDERYIAGGFKFSLEYEEILHLLMDKSLYPDPSLFLRELLQNALDACSRKRALAIESGNPSAYTSSIAVWDRSRDPVDPLVILQDNGVGMSLEVVEQYFLRVGRSYYKSADFEAERRRLECAGAPLDVCSQFGIGILSCFLVADNFEVETYQFGYHPLRIEVKGPTKYFLIQKLPRQMPPEFPLGGTGDHHDGPPARTGTRITVHLRPRTEIDVRSTLETFAVNCDHPIKIYQDSQRRPRVIAANRWERLSDVELLDRLMAQHRSWEELYARLSCFGFYTSDGWQVEIDQQSFLEVVAPVPCPLNRWPFSNHLRGMAYLWLLRDDVQPRPSRGYLRLDDSLRLTGAAQFASYLDARWRPISQIDRKELAALFANTSLHRRSALGKIFKEDCSYVVACLKRCTTEERQALRSRYLAGRNGNCCMLTAAEMLRSLRDGTLAWAESGIRLDGNFKARLNHDFRESRQTHIALHSILIPGGIVRFTRSRTQLERLNYSGNLAEVFVDARGVGAPSLVASRLFIDEDGGRELMSSYLRPILRFGCDLAAAAGSGNDWRDWLGCILGNVNSDQSLITTGDLAYCERVFRYMIRTKNGSREVSRQELTRRFGRRIPIAREREAGPGLVAGDLMTNMVLAITGDGWRGTVELP